MKTLADGTEVPSRIYYYLLDFNDCDNWATMKALFNKDKLKDLDIEDFLRLFKVASEKDFNTLLEKY
jgi:hypothetical protein